MNRDHGSEEPNHERWLVSYADFITLMFAFFTVLYATSEKNMEKSQEFQESIKRYLIKAGAGFGHPETQPIKQEEKRNSVIEPPIETFNTGKPEAGALRDQLEGFVTSELSEQDRKKYVQDISDDEWGVRITLPSSALFSPGGEKFRPDATGFVAKLGAALAKTNRRIIIEGHVASGEVGDSLAWDFASARAVNLLRFIQKVQNIDGKRLSASSYGDTRPLFSGEDKRPLNSRIEIVLLNPDLD